jgi:hypothetical protein
MKKQLLDFDCDYNFMLFAISCTDPDYKFCVQLNQSLNLQLEKEFPLKLTDIQFEDDFLFSFFSYLNDESQVVYQLITNKSYNLVKEKSTSFSISQPGLFDAEPSSISGKINYFLAELLSYDYLFVVRTPYNIKIAKTIEYAINSVANVFKVDYIEVNDLKSKDNLIWE